MVILHLSEVSLSLRLCSYLRRINSYLFFIDKRGDASSATVKEGGHAAG